MTLIKDRHTLQTFNGVKVALFIIPALIVLGIFWVLPLIMGFIFSLFHWNFGQNPVWVGWHEYQLVMSSSLFWQSLVNTILFALGVVGVGTALAIMLALILYQEIAGKGLFRTLLFIPYVMPLVASSTIWLWIYQPGVGLLDRMLQLVGLPGSTSWVQNTTWALPAIILFTIWYSLGFTTLLFLAGLTTVSPELGEAALIDGASPWMRFRRITWPLLSPTTLFVIIVNTIGVFQSFTQIFELTRGGPLGATTTLTYLVYEDAFQYFHFGTSLATGVLLFIVVAGITALQFLVSRRAINYGD
ncbi:MAG: sugar ABC transporter permease [Firmicutes bacterium]|nr:sugar ABC transporter permease [Bacillota bacterium]MCL5972516.1 sugar ABC transporter permease [Bacillota bacterium]